MIKGHISVRNIAYALVALLVLAGASVILWNATHPDSGASKYWREEAKPFGIKSWTQVGKTLYLEIENKENRLLVLSEMEVGDVKKSFGKTGVVFRPLGSQSIALDGFPMCDRAKYSSFSYGVVLNYESDALHYESGGISARTQIGEKPIVGDCAFK